MSSVDMSDPHISMAYNALQLNDPLRWFLLAHSSRPNVLVLCASGTGDLDELRAHLTPENVSYGVFREQNQNKFLYVLLNYIPDSAKGVWRARALVNGKAVSSQFKVHQVLNASHPDQVTVQALRNILRLPPRVPQVPSSSPLLGAGERTNVFSIQSKPTPDVRSAPVSSVSSPSIGARSPSPVDIGRSHSGSAASQLATSRTMELQKSSIATEDLASTGNGPSAPIIPTSSTTRSTSPPPLANIVTAVPYKSITRIIQSDPNANGPHSPLVTSPISVQSGSESHHSHSPQHTSGSAKQGSTPPPPPPPKGVDELQDADRRSVDSDGRPGSSHMGSIPDSNSSESPYILNHFPSPAPPSSVPPQPADKVSSSQFVERKPSLSITSPAFPPPSSSDYPSNGTPSNGYPGKSNDGIVTNRVATGDPTGTSASTNLRSRFREKAADAADAKEEKKLIVLEDERRRRAAERARREREEREEEEAREREFEERKERERKRRLESARRAEERRVEQKRRQEEEEARQRAEKEQREEELRQKRDHIKQRFEKKAGMDLLSGFITLESSSSWKRRYYRLSTEDWIFFKSDKETTTPIHALELSRVRALREWHEGYDELEAIPNSFAVELQDDAPCLFFADSAEDKEILLGLLNQAAGL